MSTAEIDEKFGRLHAMVEDRILELLDVLEEIDRMWAEARGVELETWAPPDIQGRWLLKKLMTRERGREGGGLPEASKTLWVVKAPRQEMPENIKPLWRHDGGAGDDSLDK